MHCASGPSLSLVGLCRAVPLINTTCLPPSQARCRPTSSRTSARSSTSSSTAPPSPAPYRPSSPRCRGCDTSSSIRPSSRAPSRRRRSATCRRRAPSTWHSHAVHVALTRHSRPRGTHVHVALTRTHTPSTWQIYDLEIASCELSGTLPASVYALGARGAPTTEPPPHSSRHV